MKLTQRAPYSYRSDPQVPHFEDGGPIVFMDGECVLCGWTARIIVRLDRVGEFRICPVQSPIGTAIIEHYGLDPADPDSWLYLEAGRAYTSLDAVIRVGKRLGGWGRLMLVFRIFPRPLQDWIYRRVARNRYVVTGRTQMCVLADPALQQRLLQ